MTYSIVARDPVTGELGVAVQSRSFRTGAAVPWVRPGVGAIATQSMTDRRYGAVGLDRLEAGESAKDVLAALRATDPAAPARQVAIVDGAGSVAAFTGADCVPATGYALGDGFCAQGNMLASEDVFLAMAESFSSSSGSLHFRLLAALEAAEAAGGDWRGSQAGAIVVAPAEGAPWGRWADVRVDDHPEPVAELRRLLTLEEGYRRVSLSHERARAARKCGLPDLDVLWAEIHDALAADDLERARALFAPLRAEEPRWVDFARLLGRHGGVPNVEALVA